jgi:lipopolysaccharide biosynthesis regulator YciM
MTLSHPLITCSDEQNNANDSTEFNIFLLSDSDALNFTDNKLPNDFLKNLVFLVARKPKRLITHIQRIHHCYQTNLQEQLFAALVDLLVVLNRRGKAISRRMIIGAKSKLSEEQFKMLLKFVAEDFVDIALLSGNQYSVFTKGLVGTGNLVQQSEAPDTPEHDPLVLAHDYIEFSQLDEAKDILEKAIVNQPQRLELHQCLLELYKSTLDTSGFTTMFNILVGRDVAMPNDWNTLQAFFNERKK